MKEKIKNIWMKAVWINHCMNGFRFLIVFATGISIVQSLLGVLFIWLFKNMVDIATNAKDGSMYHAILSIAFVLIIQELLDVVNSFLSIFINQRFSNALRAQIYEEMLSLKWNELTKYHTGNLLTRINTDTASIVQLTSSLLPGMAVSSIQLIAAFGVMLWLDPTVALFSLLFLPVAYLLFLFLGKKMKRLNHEYQNAVSDNNSFIQETLQNSLVIKAFGLKKSQTDRLRGYQQRSYKIAFRKNAIGAASSSIMGLGFSASYIAAFLFSAYRMSKGILTFGDLSAFLQLVSQIQNPIYHLTDGIPRILSSYVSAERLLEVISGEKDREDLPEKKLEPAGIELSHITFSYRNGEPVLSDISICLEPGTATAIIGKTGAGKTTLLRLLLSLAEPDSGTIVLYNSEESVQNNVGFRCNFSYVPQGNSLFSGTILENLLLVRPDATKEQIETAIRCACAEFIWEFPEKEHTKIGEKNMGLSEGQALRVAIARALLRNAPILIFDEATSALDEVTQQMVTDRIREHFYNKTLIFITHKLSMAAACDKILMVGGRKAIWIPKEDLSPEVLTWTEGEEADIK